MMKTLTLNDIRPKERQYLAAAVICCVLYLGFSNTINHLQPGYFLH